MHTSATRGARTKRRPARTSSARSAEPRRTRWIWLHGAPELSALERRILTFVAWLAIAGVGLGLAWMALGPHRIGDYMAETDFYGGYAEGARLIQQGRLLPARYGVIGPGYEVALGDRRASSCATCSSPRELLSLVAALATLLLWFAAALGARDVRVACAAVVLVATNAHFFRYGYAATTDALAIALQAAALFLLLARRGSRAGGRRRGRGALAFLTRYNAV